MNKYTALTKPKIRELLILAQEGDLVARQKLTESMIPFAIKMTSKYYGKGMDREDYIQLAMIAILLAIDKYDLNYDTAMTTFVAWQIKHVVGDARRAGDVIRTPTKKQPKTRIGLFDCTDDKVTNKIEPNDFWFLQFLTARELYVLHCRFDKGMTFTYIGQKIGLSKQCIKQILDRLFWRIRYAEDKGRNVEDRNRLFNSGIRKNNVEA